MKNVVFAIFVNFPVAALAQVTVTDAWVRATVPQQKTTGAFMRLVSHQDAHLIEVRSPVAGTVELHQMSMENDVMKMRRIAGLDLPAGRTVELKPGGYHVMLSDLKHSISEGDVVPVTLVIVGRERQRKTIELNISVRPLNGLPIPSQP